MILFTLTYMVSYITRINFGAIVSEIEQSTGFLRSALSMALTGSFITYGTGQIVSGVLGDKVSPKRLVSIGLIITCTMNILIPLCPSPVLMLIVWCINGFAQSFMWPPIVRIMTALLSSEDYKDVTTKVLYGSSFGTIAVYLISPLLIFLAGWKAVFFFSAACAIIMLVFWNKYSYEIPKEKATVKKEEKSSGNNKMLFTPVMLCIMAAIILQGMLRDGVTTWMPTYISEVYDLSNIISILTGVILPIFSIVCIKITYKLYSKHFTNLVWCAFLIFALSAVSAISIYFLSGRLVAFSVLFSALLTGCMHGVNYLLVCMIPAYFKKYKNVSTASGVINSCTYIGSALSTYGIAFISERLGWSFTIITWIVIGLLGSALCLISFKGWEKKYQD